MRKYLISILIIIQAIVGFRVNAAVEFASSTLFGDANKVAYWKLENVNDNGGTYNLTNVNTTTFGSAKFSNGSVTDGVNQYLYNTNTAFSVTGAMSVVGWFCTTNYSGTPYVVMSRLASNAVGEIYGLRISNAGQTQFMVWASSGGFLTIPGNTISTSTCSTAANFYHFALVTVSTSDRRLFINGAKVGNSTTSRTPDGTSKAGIAIGAYDYGSGVANQFPGRIDDVVFFNRALSDAEVLGLYNETGGGGATSTLIKSTILMFE